MKRFIQLTTLASLMLMTVGAGATIQLQLPAKTLAIGHKYIIPIDINQRFSADPLLLLQKNYPAVYKNLLVQFNKVESLNYTVKEDELHISFSKDKNNVFTVYSIDGKFKCSIENMGLALPTNITEQLKKHYPAYSVFNGKNIRVNNKTMYEVIIENETEYRVINFYDTEMEEVKSLKK